MIELECLGVTWAMYKCRQFIEGLPSFEVITDHKPLIPILNDYAFDKLDNPRLLRLRLKMQRFSFVAKRVPGKSNTDADALSRELVDKATAADELAEGTPSFSPRVAMLSAIELSEPSVLDPVLEKVKSAAAVDPVMFELRELVLRGFTNEKANLSLPMRSFWAVRYQLAIDEDDDIIVMGARVVVPSVLRRDIVNDLVDMHQGATKLRQRARLALYRPHMDVDIANAARNCTKCFERLPSHPPEPLVQRQPAYRPFEQIRADLGEHKGKHFLIFVDHFSG